MPLLQRLSVRVVLVAGFMLLGITLLFLRFGHGSSSFMPAAIGEHAWSGDSSLDDISNATLGFQKIYVINLKSRTDHRDRMSLAAALTGLHFEYIDGVTEVNPKALPPEGKKTNLDKGGLGNWRAHMDVVRLIVEENITSALVLEDDVDWDIRIKDQLKDFAKASRTLLQPLAGTQDKFLDPTYPRPQPDQGVADFDVTERWQETAKPTTSPYGDIDRWDLFWLGHCGCRFPRASDQHVPLGRAVIKNDETVPERQHVEMQFGDTELVSTYPDHTRVVSRAWQNTCTIGYGISQPGARRVLYELGLNKMTGTNDMMFRSICHGSEDRTVRTCLTVQPQLFQHHRIKGPKSGGSDISENSNGEIYDKSFTRNVRWSTQMNLANLLDGSSNITDHYLDGEEADKSLSW